MNGKHSFKEFLKGFRTAFKGKVFKNGAYMLLVCVIALGLTIGVNYLFEQLPSAFRAFDTSNYGLYEIGDETKAFLDTLEQDVDIYLTAQTGEENDNLMRFVKEYVDYSMHISFHTIDYVLQPLAVGELTKHTVYSNSLIFVSGDKNTVVDIDSVFIEHSEYDEETDTSSLSSIEFAGESAITSAIKYVTSDDLPIVAFITGHSEASLSSEAAEDFLKGLENENFSYGELNLTSEPDLLQYVDSIVINAPMTDISSVELQVLMDYFDAGGNILVYTLYAEEGFENLRELLLYCGMEMSRGIIFEEDGSYHAANVPAAYADLPSNLYLLPLIQSHAITDPLLNGGYLVHMLYAHDVSEAEMIRDSVSLTPLLMSSETSVVLSGGNEQTGAQFTLGMLAEEKIGDYTASCVWFGSPLLIDDTMNEMSSGANCDLFINTLSYLSDYESGISIHTKSMPVTWLTFTSNQQLYVSLLLEAAVPLLVLIIGFAVWYRRRAK